MAVEVPAALLELVVVEVEDALGELLHPASAKVDAESNVSDQVRSRGI